jgi:hypothetical protein
LEAYPPKRGATVLTQKMKQHIEDAEQHMMDYHRFYDTWHVAKAVDEIINALKESMDDTPDMTNKDTQ